MRRTPGEIRRLGLAALRRALGPSGMIQFIQQFAKDTGDYAKDRHQWLDCLTMDDIEVLIAEHRRDKAAAGRARSARRTRKTAARKQSRKPVSSQRRA